MYNVQEYLSVISINLVTITLCSFIVNVEPNKIQSKYSHKESEVGKLLCLCLAAWISD